MKRILNYFLLTLITLPVALNANECDGILTNGLHNISEERSEGAQVNYIYRSNCGLDFSQLSDEMIGNIEVKVFGYGEGSGGFSRNEREKRLREWCNINKSTAERHNSDYAYSKTIYSRSVSAWESCIKFSKQQFRIKPQINGDQTKVILSLSFHSGTSGTPFFGVDANGFDCKYDIYDAEGKISHSIDDEKPPYINNYGIVVSCDRNNLTSLNVEGDELQMWPAATIAIKTAEESMLLDFSEKWLTPFPGRAEERLQRSID